MTDIKLDINRSNILVCGIGTKGMKYPTKTNREFLKEYKLWRGLLYRCTEHYWINKPAYINTVCSKNFAYYPFFYEWCHSLQNF